MKALNICLFASVLLVSCQPDAPYENKNLTQYVDPQIGAIHGRWFFYTPAAVPFGMAKLAPHTNAFSSEGGWAPKGYDDRGKTIEGFGHFHEFQVGGLSYMPTVGSVNPLAGTEGNPAEGYRSEFDKSTEQAQAGYYSVVLKKYNVKVELTATPHVGYQRYTFPKTDQANLIIDVGHSQGESGQMIDSYAKLTAENRVEGYIETYPVYATFCDPGKHVKMYFSAQLGKAPKAYGAFKDAQLEPNASETKGINNGLYLTFDAGENEAIEIKTGLSYTSIENARANLNAEITDFETAKTAAARLWNEALNKIVVEGGSAENQTKFYTGLYHALLGRGISNDVNGQYPILDRVEQIPLDAEGQPSYNTYNTDGMWGGFWNLSQVWGLAYPGHLSRYIQSNIDMYKHRGWLHDGAANGVYTNGVQTNFQGLLIASAYNMGIRDFEVDKGYAAAVKNELDSVGRNLGNGKYDLDKFMKYGYVPYGNITISNGWVFNFGASHTLEYAFSSYAVAQMAKQRNDKENYQKLMRQANYWKNLFDPDTKFIRPKTPDGQFIKEFNPLKAWDGFQEGNAYQYTWYVPHDVSALINTVGKDLFAERLETMFEDADKTNFGGDPNDLHSFSAVEKLYNQGNQPSLHNAFLFNYIGRPWLTQKWVRSICDKFYGLTPSKGYGLGQDEDQGQLGSWFVLASIGLFDVQGHAAERPTFQFSTPMFETVSIALDHNYYSGKKLVIKTKNLSPENIYIQSVTFNDKPIEACWIYRDLLMQGGDLVFTLGKDPNPEWGTATPPPSMSDVKAD